MPYYVYILTNKPRGVLYVGVTNNLDRRVLEHKEKVLKGFATKYRLSQLVYAEEYDWVSDAIRREKQLKSWYRQWKIDLIESFNPRWIDLYGSHSFRF